MYANSYRNERNIQLFSLSLSIFSVAALHHLINGDNSHQSFVTCKLAEVVGSEMKIDPWAFADPGTNYL